MEESHILKRLEWIGVALKLLSAIQVIIGVSILTVILFMVNAQTLALAAEEIMIPGETILAIAVMLLLLLTASGLVSLYRVRYGWVFVFTVASLILLMGLLLGTGTVLLTRISFCVMMILSAVVWAGAVVYYFWDLYT